MDANVYINNKCELVVEPDIFEEGEKSLIEWEVYKMINRCSSDNISHDKGVYVEFLVSSNTKIKDTIVISKERGFYTFPIPNDGFYIYYCIKTVDSEQITDLIKEGFDGLYYDVTTNNLIFQQKPVTDYEKLISALPTLLNEKEGVSDYIEKYAFSICNLKKCLIELQKESVNKYNSCDKMNELIKLRDLLFISIYVLETLIYQERFSEAMDVLNSINACNSFCTNIPIKSKSNCNCHG